MRETSSQVELFAMATPPKILTIRQPWAWAIIHADKNVENRTWKTSYRGRLLIHAGRKVDPAGIEFLQRAGIEIPPEALEGGDIIGSVQLTDCVTGSTSPWAMPDCWHWLLADPTPATSPIAHQGQLSLSNAPADWEQAFA